MRPAHPTETVVGIEYYLSDADGTGGRLKSDPADFRVRELEDVDVRPLSSDAETYPHLIVRITTTGWDTYDFASRLARELGIHRDAIRWAGTKDKEATTTQLFSIPQADPEALPEIPNATIEPVGRFGRALTFGDLLGNQFNIRVRDPDHPEHHEDVTRSLRVGEAGRIAVPNYFGTQRFGTMRPVTHRVGLAVIEEDWKAAVMTYLGGPSEAEPPATREARTFVEETRDWDGALERFPHVLGHERRMLRYLSDTTAADSDRFRGALSVLPDTLRQLFVHAAQSYLFNRMLSERLARDVPVDTAQEGDVVCFGRETDALGTVPDMGRLQRVTADREDAINRHVRNGRAFVTLPLVGTESTLGTGAPGAIERDVLQECGLSPADFELEDPYGSTGTRRPALVSTAIAVDEQPLEFQFGLPSGSYATVVLREYLKTPPAALE